MAGSQHTTIAILGVGKGGSALLDLLTHIPNVTVIRVADKNPSAPGIQRALEQGVPVASNIMDPIQQDGIDLIMAVNLVERGGPRRSSPAGSGDPGRRPAHQFPREGIGTTFHIEFPKG